MLVPCMHGAWFLDGDFLCESLSLLLTSIVSSNLQHWINHRLHVCTALYFSSTDATEIVKTS